jgi:hypothetical protein
MKKDSIVMFLLGLSTLLFIYISPFPARCHEYTGGIYDLEYYYHPPIIFLFFFFHFVFLFSFFFIFQFTLYQLLSMGSICHFIKTYSYEILF